MEPVTVDTVVVTGPSTPAPTAFEAAVLARFDALETKLNATPPAAAAAPAPVPPSDPNALQAAPRVPAGATNAFVDLTGLDAASLIKIGLDQRARNRAT